MAAVCATAHIGTGSFDHHSNYDKSPYISVMRLFYGMDLVAQAAQEQGLLDLSATANPANDGVVMIMGSAFGRTNIYNDNVDDNNEPVHGKDRPLGSMMFLGKGIQRTGTIGSTDAEVRLMLANLDANDPLDPANMVKKNPAIQQNAVGCSPSISIWRFGSLPVLVHKPRSYFLCRRKN